jgi:CRISPR-associated protein Csb1
MADELTLDDLRAAVSGNAAAFRCRRRLQPGGGEGDKVFPPTFAGAVYGVEQRRVPGRDEPATCVLLDSVQSQANRMEEALQDAMDAGRIAIPLVAVDFSGSDPTGDAEQDREAGRLIDAVGRVTSIQAPHRLADAILRDSEHEGVAFRASEVGRPLNTASPLNATPLLALCPTALVFGMWDSTGPKGGLGPKFERAIVSEVVGISAEAGDALRGVRRDPLGVRAAVKILKAADKTWEIADPKAKGAVSPSEVNHANVIFPKSGEERPGGVTVEYAEQVTTLSLICLRRLRFPVDGTTDAALDSSARTVLAALGLCAATLAFEAGLGLRSRCLLWPDGPMEWELLDRPGERPRVLSLTGDAAVALLRDSVDAMDRRLPWRREPVVLQPSAKLVDLVRRSQLEATKEDAGQGD